MDRILIVEDDREMNQGIRYVLETEGYLVAVAYSLSDAREAYTKQAVDLILLDVNMPDGEGFEFCKWVKGQRSIPIIFLTARDLEADALRGYELGADDYITKPFSIHILLKKISVILKRAEGSERHIFADDFLKIDFDMAKVTVCGKICAVTPTEFRILRLFVDHGGQLLTYAQLLEQLWDSGGQFVDKHTLAVNVNRLRGKIEDAQHKYISNIYGMGYQWLK